MTTSFFLIRHGQTNYSLEKKYCGSSNIDLNNTGRRQAKMLRRRLKEENIDTIYSSDTKRAFTFAARVFPGRPIEKIPELRELDFGIFEGLTYSALMEKHAGLYTAWLRDPSSTDIPGGESLASFRKRIFTGWRNIVVANRNKTLAVVTHAGPIRIILGAILNLKDIREATVDLASITTIRIQRGQAKLITLNETGYLRG
ncbi:MAG: histidine phosphatase family protein [Elusimicrobia bacterium]|nr:histidine phosphatase family protein [Elusimicrobiota bacterium]